MKKAVCTFLLVAAFSPGHAVGPSLTLRLICDPCRFELGTPIKLRASFENVGDDPFYVQVGPDVGPNALHLTLQRGRCAYPLEPQHFDASPEAARFRFVPLERGRRLEFAREIQLGEGRRLIVVSASGAGGLAAFRADGSLLQTMATGAITMIQLFDLDEDGVSEVIVEEVEGKGTGALMKSFVLLVAGRERLTEAWRQPSYRREARSDPAAPSASAPVEIHNFLRFDRSGAGRPARMTYLLGPQGGCSFRERVFELTERGLHQVPNTPDPGSGNTTCR